MESCASVVTIQQRAHPTFTLSLMAANIHAL